MLNKLAFMPDTVGNNTFLRNPSGHVSNLFLRAGQTKSFTPPEGTRVVIFASDGAFYASTNGSGIPSGDVIGTGTELSPLGYQLGTETLTLSAPNDTHLSIACYL